MILIDGGGYINFLHNTFIIRLFNTSEEFIVYTRYIMINDNIVNHGNKLQNIII